MLYQLQRIRFVFVQIGPKQKSKLRILKGNIAGEEKYFTSKQSTAGSSFVVAATDPNVTTTHNPTNTHSSQTQSPIHETEYKDDPVHKISTPSQQKHTNTTEKPIQVTRYQCPSTKTHKHTNKQRQSWLQKINVQKVGCS